MLLSTLHEPRKAAFHAWQMRLSFGRGMESGILSHEIATKSSGNTPLMQIMQQYAHDIGSNLSAQEIERYINLGEHLVRAITQGRLQEDNKLRIPQENGGEHIVQSNLETARAISWYLQAKGVMDHASPDFDPHLLNRGSMLVADKDSHLFRFLNSAPNTHGRISTHFNERSTSEPATLSNTGVLGKAGSLFSPSATAQRAIEDFSKRMPSGKGNMTFDRLQEDDGTPLLFLKWETVGVPTALGNVRHVDKEDGFRAALSAQIKTLGRNAAHCVNLVQHSVQKGGSGPNWGIRREDVHRGEAEPLYNKFKAIVQDAGKMEGKEWGTATIKAGKKKGLYHIKEVLQDLEKKYTAFSHLSDHQTQLAGIGTLLEEIREFEGKMGKNLGINRKGAEIHVSLDMSYLDRGTVAKSVSLEQPNGKTMEGRNGKFLRKLRKELSLRSNSYSRLAHFKAAVSDIKSKVSHAMNKNAKLVVDLSGQELKKVVTESLSDKELNEISIGRHTSREGRPGRFTRTGSFLNAAVKEQTKRKQLCADIEAKLTTSESFGSITPQNLRTWREKNRPLKTPGKDKFESLTPGDAGKADFAEIATPKKSLADWLRTDPIENSTKQGFAKADSRQITEEETDEEEIYEEDRTSFSSKDYSSQEEQVSTSKSSARPALGRAGNSSPSKWEKDVLEALKKHTPATDKWLREHNYAVAKNHGSGMNCLLIALLQHATGRYNDQHEQQAQQIRAQLEERHGLVAPGEMLSVFSDDDPILRDAVKIINDLHNTSLDPVIVYPTEDGHPNKGREDDKIGIASQKNLIVYGRHGDLHFEALRKMPAATT